MKQAWRDHCYGLDACLPVYQNKPTARALVHAVLNRVPVNPEHPHDKELHEALLRLHREVDNLP